MRLVKDKTLEPVNVGDVLHTFRGEPVIVTGWREPGRIQSTGRVYLRSMDERGIEGEYFPSVINCHWRV